MAKSKEDKAPVFVVVSEFRDANNFDTLYEAGQDVSDLDEERLNGLIEKGLVKKDDK